MNVVLCLAIFFVGANGQASLAGPDRILRPCATYDLHCIRRFFAAHSKCHVMHGPVPHPMYFAHTVSYITAANVTITTDDLYRTLDGKIEEFYINRATDRLLIAVEFRNLSIYSNNSYVAYHRRGREPIINKTYVTILIPSMTVTMIFPNINHLDVRLAEATAYFNSAINAFALGPNAFKGVDPGLQKAAADLVLAGNVALQEGFMTDAYQDILGYIQHYICDFGIKLS